MTYQLSFNRHKFLVADIPLEEIYEKHGTYYPFQDEHEQELESWQVIWKPLNIRFYNDSDSNITAIPDITCWFTDQLIMNDKTFKRTVKTVCRMATDIMRKHSLLVISRKFKNRFKLRR
ncbi:hypothetical protein MAH1_07550 [Sessilibacter sp. MAH1]